ncbi:hypothetical protein EHI8A_182800 [Entamoeba histolytica HM-1:IMSS-B]|uniref:Uncharacterized protein n=6 Tax=Entamoeba histolytica TaxID=5759 RepID=B1N2D7_ENTH1|nr:hypothetical protein EHI_153550 [Entamoeba histolytica HM-1:IMSS]EMD45365.1 Hypothetical protein EHI5A_186360 [Entamoeba histolytica KU27]EMH73376.1 hypothetical protein EHI8A_182800 [Entamoeba histolytica HM-1:IMSS-B]EMS15152.1 hypothetical protein KM1_250180 [Entamoeba histolytica HM-3:IMSS]ENY61346.1 hypothetical protein EHI7A_159400 [Entamoeba histolytica HM-1:IMSS-A]GAT91612.1 hypothetical protein CL6EHI_153550 [Entamoeba histolytica]|eukprot:XP_001913363.1 hypothetical protein EHI_153550 [Entamoeba histolytica HM-1:IMSS]
MKPTPPQTENLFLNQGFQPIQETKRNLIQEIEEYSYSKKQSPLLLNQNEVSKQSYPELLELILKSSLNKSIKQSNEQCEQPQFFYSEYVKQEYIQRTFDLDFGNETVMDINELPLTQIIRPFKVISPIERNKCSPKKSSRYYKIPINHLIKEDDTTQIESNSFDYSDKSSDTTTLVSIEEIDLVSNSNNVKEITKWLSNNIIKLTKLKQSKLLIYNYSKQVIKYLSYYGININKIPFNKCIISNDLLISLLNKITIKFPQSDLCYCIKFFNKLEETIIRIRHYGIDYSKTEINDFCNYEWSLTCELSFLESLYQYGNNMEQILLNNPIIRYQLRIINNIQHKNQQIQFLKRRLAALYNKFSI